VRWVDTQIEKSVMFPKVRESSETRPRVRREQKREGERDEKGGDDANASRHGGAVKRSKSRVEGRQRRKSRRKRADEAAREEEKRK
jgi:hypothetical protein